MTKQKTKISIVIISVTVLLIIAAAIVGFVYAYSILVDHNYNVTAYSGGVTATIDQDSLEITSSGTDVIATKADVIIDSSVRVLEVDSFAPYKTVEIISTSKSIDPDTLEEITTESISFRHVFTGLDMGIYTLSNADATVVKAAIAQAQFTSADSKIHTAIYENHYVSSQFDLWYINNEGHFNDIFELWDNSNNNTTKSAVVYILCDIEIDQDTKLNIPVSINLLDSTLLLNNNFKIEHGYAGRYFVTATSGTVDTAAGKSFDISTSKAYYSVHQALPINLAVQGLKDTQNINAALADAAAFAASSLPLQAYYDIALPQQYRSTNITFSYQANSKSFYGRVRTEGGANDLVRTANTYDAVVEVTATYGSHTATTSATLKVIGTLDKAVLDSITNEISDVYGASSFGNIDLLPAIKTAYTMGGLINDITVSATGNGAGVNATDINAVTLLINGSKTLSTTLKFENGVLKTQGTPVISLMVAKNGVVIIDEFGVKLQAGSSSAEIKFDILKSSTQEILYYLKSNTKAFITNAPYSLYNLAKEGEQTDPDTGDIIDGTGFNVLYLGLTRLCAADTLAISDVKYSLAKIAADGTKDTAYATATYFKIDNTAKTLEILSEETEIPDDMYLEYEFVINQNTYRFVTKVIKSLAGDSGSDEDFQSTNPFDAMFLSSSVNWLEGSEFNSSAADYYAKIEITAINYVDINSISGADSWLKKIVTIQNSGESASKDANVYYKSVKLKTNLDYVPDSNTVFKVTCVYFNAVTGDSGEVILTRDYTFTVKGVLKCVGIPQRETAVPSDATPYVFEDAVFYGFTIDQIEKKYGTNYVSTLQGGVKLLLSDVSYAADLVLDYSGYSYTGAGLDLTGINKLRTAVEISLNGLTLSDISAFKLFSGSSLELLSMSGCGITNAVLANNLSNLLVARVNLSYNNITQTVYEYDLSQDILHRSVEDLNLSNQLNLTDISGLSNLTYLSTLDVSNNNIARFEILKQMIGLETAYVFGNELSSIYGSMGQINLPVYVWIIKTSGVEVYAQSGYILTLEDIGLDVVAACTDLNAFAVPMTLYSAAATATLRTEITQLADGDTFKFYRISDGYVSDAQVFFNLVDSGNNTYSFIVAFVDQFQSVVALREFVVTLEYSI